MVEVKFYRGPSNKYNLGKHSEGIYFSTDTHEIFHKGNSYGIPSVSLDGYATVDFVEDSLCGYVNDLVYTESTGTFSYKKRIKTLDGSYSYEEVTFSLVNDFRGAVKNLDYNESTHSLMFTEFDVKEGKITNTSKTLEIPEATNELSGLMNPEDKNSINSLLSALTWNYGEENED